PPPRDFFNYPATTYIYSCGVSSAGSFFYKRQVVGVGVAIDKPDALTALVWVKGWVTIIAHTRGFFEVR
ncbi:hypothetical protein ACVGWN_24770, partial [Enterobacter hormaechei]